MRAVVLCAATLAIAPAVHAQQTAAHVQFRVVDADGAPVADLTAADVTLKIDGHPRPIRSLVLRQADATSGGVTSKLPPPYASNTAGGAGRAIVLLIDEDSMAPGREAPFKAALHQFLTELPPGDSVGVLSTQSRINVAPGTDRAVTHQAIDRITGQGNPNESDIDATCRTVMLLKAVTGIVATPSNTPLVLAVFSGGITPVSADAFRIGTASGTCEIRREDLQNLSRAAAVTPLAAYVMHLTEGDVARTTAQTAGLESLAGALGGSFIRVSTDATAALARVLRETSTFYDAQFDADAADRDGQSHRVELRTTRDHVHLQAPTAIALSRRAQAPRSPRELLRTSTEYRDLPLRATGYAARGSGDEVKIVALFEAASAATLTAASVAIFDEKNTLKRQWTAQAADLARRPVMAALTAPPGSYRMRVAAVDDGGRAGTTDYPLDARLIRADPLRTSGIVLGTQENGGFVPRLEFSTEQAAIGLIEIYGVPKSANVTLSLDVAASDTEAPLATAETAVSRTKTDGTLVAYGGFDISRLAPGDYLMRAVVSLDGKAVGRVTRTLRKVRTAGR